MTDLFTALAAGLVVCLLLVAVFGVPYWIWMGRVERRSFWSWRPQGHSTLGPDTSGPEETPRPGSRIPG